MKARAPKPQRRRDELTATAAKTRTPSPLALTRPSSRRRLRAGALAEAGGFTLIEIILAFTVLLLGVVGVYALFSVALISHKRAIDNTNAAILAASIFDDIAANYGAFYYDRDHNGVPDLAEDNNNDGIPDWHEIGAGGRIPYPVPYRDGYAYTVFYVRSDYFPQELFVTVEIYWLQQGNEHAVTFQRTIYLKNIEELEAGG